MANLGSRTYSNIFWTFLELLKDQLNMDPWTPYSSPRHFKKYKVQSQIILKHIIFTYLRILNLDFGKRRAPNNDGEPFNKSWKSWMWDQYPANKHEWYFANMVPKSVTKKWHVGFLGIWVIWGSIFGKAQGGTESKSLFSWVQNNWLLRPFSKKRNFTMVESW